ncbi:MAG: flippase-like domain-containing protein [bacterium]|nr:MAG: flippase-like domain-containing protein [bacterium]
MASNVEQKPESSGKARVRFLSVAKVAVSILVLWLLLRRVDLGQAFGFLADSGKGPWSAALVLVVLSQALSSFRWQILLRPLGYSLDWVRVLKIYYIGMFFSLFLPSVIGGDGIKTFYIAGTWRRIPAALYTLLADRVIGMTALILYSLVGAASVWSRVPPWMAFSLLFAVPVIYLVVVLLPRFSQPILDLSRRMRELPRERLFVYWTDPTPALKGWTISMVVHLMIVLAHLLMGSSLGLDVPKAAWFLIYPLAGFISVIPVSLNGIGLREAAYVYLLGLFGVGPEKAFSLGLMWFSMVLINGLLGGLPYLLGGELKVKEALTTENAESDIPESRI